ncbi:MAG: PIN domain-containing protein [Acidobacteriaceae bacterium]
MTTYLDTAVAVWLAQGSLDRISPAALEHLRGAAMDCRMSPAVLLELEFLYEIGRILLPAADIQRKLESEAGVTVCEMGFAEVVETALRENWTRDPFDRLITAQARANALAWLVTSDRRIREAYPRAIW